MRLQRGLLEQAPDAAIANVEALTSKVVAEQRLRPVRYRDANFLRRPAGFRLDARRIGVREREGGRPERGLTGGEAVRMLGASLETGSSVLEKRWRHSNMGSQAQVNAERPGRVSQADAGSHQQKRLTALNHSLLGRRRADRCFDRLTLRGRERQRLRPGAGVYSPHPGLRIDHGPAACPTR